MNQSEKEDIPDLILPLGENVLALPAVLRAIAALLTAKTTVACISISAYQHGN